MVALKLLYFSQSLIIQLNSLVSLIQYILVYSTKQEYIENSMIEQKSHSKAKQNLGQDVINMYKGYKDTKTVFKKTTIRNVVFELPDYYKPFQLIGSGAYGAVSAVIDTRLPADKQQQNMLAVKKMTNAFQHKIYARRILRELKLLRLLKHQNIIQIKTILLPQSRQNFQDIYVVFDLMDSDIFSLLKRGEEQLTQVHYQCFVYQILRGLKYIHSANVIHRDIKTRNLLINANCDIKICDFGLARTAVRCQKEGMMTDYVATRWYRAPQLLLGDTNYTSAVDIWSVGCIMAQLILKKAFLPATTTKQQLELICQMVQPSDLQNLKKNKGQHYDLVIKILQKKKKKKNPIDQKIQGVSPLGIDLLKKMLAFSPQKRITAKQAIQHPYFQQFREPDLQTDSPSINNMQFQFQSYSLTTQQLKDLIYEQILIYNFPEFKKTYETKLNSNQSVITQILKNSNSKNIDPEADADCDDQNDI